MNNEAHVLLLKPWRAFAVSVLKTFQHDGSPQTTCTGAEEDKDTWKWRFVPSQFEHLPHRCGQMARDVRHARPDHPHAINTQHRNQVDLATKGIYR